MKKSEFRPEGYVSITNCVTLLVQIVHEEGKTFAYTAFSSGGSISDHFITRSRIRFDKDDNMYFMKGRDKYYLSEVMKIK